MYSILSVLSKNLEKINIKSRFRKAVNLNNPLAPFISQLIVESSAVTALSWNALKILFQLLKNNCLVISP